MLAITVLLAAGISVLIYILLPVMKPVQAWMEVPEEDEYLIALKGKKESYLRAIKDIDFEYASDKINTEDYKNLKNYYTLKAAETIKELEKTEKPGREEKTGE